MDADGKGEVLLVEFCAWLAQGEIEADTEIGRELKFQEDRPVQARPVVNSTKKSIVKSKKEEESKIETETPAELASFLAALN